MTAASSPPLLDAEHAEFVAGAVSIVAASRDDHNVPSLGRAVGCVVAPDRRSLRVFVAQAQAAQLLADIRASGQVAVVFTKPSTNRSLQIKATDARVRPLRDGEEATSARYVEAFGIEITPLGHVAEQARTLFRHVEGDLVAIEFTPSAAFVQTPGPGAGAALKSAS
jgi:hypothetical protein